MHMGSMEITTACPHCAKPLAEAYAARHVASCLAKAELANRVRALLCTHHERGYLMTTIRYDALAKQHGFPHHKTLTDHCGGTWADVAAWCGLRYQPPGRGNLEWRTANERADSIGPQPELAEEHRMFEGMPARPGVLVRAAWCVKTHRYVPVLAETGWCRLW